MPTTTTVICRWFALCDHEAVGTVPHPVLGDVPACQRCVDKLDLPLQPFKEVSVNAPESTEPTGDEEQGESVDVNIEGPTATSGADAPEPE